MAVPLADSLLRYIRKLAGRGAGLGAVSDAEALRRFMSERDEAAFELLVWRHGGMVLHLCRGILHDEHAAEDAFQGTFLVLARKAGSVVRQTSLAGWLYQVAYRIALKAQTQARKHASPGSQPLEQLPDARAGEPADVLTKREMEPLLYAEVNRLPAKYRDPVVLCYLQGQTNEEVARQLGWPVGTVSGRLARARTLLRKRLTARGVVLPAGLLVASVAEGPSLAAVPASLIVTTTRAALRFAAARKCIRRRVHPGRRAGGRSAENHVPEQTQGCRDGAARCGPPERRRGLAGWRFRFRRASGPTSDG